MNHLKYIFILFFAVQIQAETLKSLALKSTALLFLADDMSAQKKCRLNNQSVSLLSQALKMRIDSRIEKLTDADFEILNQRIEICHLDCSCSIYSYAYELRNQENKKISDKASKETHADRKKCVSKIKNICQFIK